MRHLVFPIDILYFTANRYSIYTELQPTFYIALISSMLLALFPVKASCMNNFDKNIENRLIEIAKFNYFIFDPTGGEGRVVWLSTAVVITS